jgi:2-keto-4-pentenoate hydratase
MENQLLGHPGHDLQCGLDRDEPWPAGQRLLDSAGIGGGCVHRPTISSQDPSIKRRPPGSVARANMIADHDASQSAVGAVTAQTNLGAAALTLWQAWSSGRALELLPPDLRPGDVAEGYAVQRALDELAGPAIGWKIAATSKAGQEHIGASGPLVGRLYQMEHRPSDSALSVRAMRMRSAEPEFAFVLARDLGRDELDVEDVLAAVGSMMLAVEVPDSRFVDFTQAGLPSLVADAMCGGHFITGPSIEGWRSLDLREQTAELVCNGDQRSAGRGANVMGDPRRALAWMANEVLGRGWPLRAGDIVITGASAPPIPVQAGDHLEAVFAGLGTVTVRFVA